MEKYFDMHMEMGKYKLCKLMWYVEKIENWRSLYVTHTHKKTIQEKKTKSAIKFMNLFRMVMLMHLWFRNGVFRDFRFLFFAHFFCLFRLHMIWLSWDNGIWRLFVISLSLSYQKWRKYDSKLICYLIKHTTDKEKLHDEKMWFMWHATFE